MFNLAFCQLYLSQLSPLKHLGGRTELFVLARILLNIIRENESYIYKQIKPGGITGVLPGKPWL